MGDRAKNLNIKTIARWVAACLGSALLAIALLMALIGVVLNTTCGQTLASSWVERLLAGSQSTKLKLESPSGFWPMSLQFGRVSLADAEGEWLVAHDISATWQPTRLFSRKILIQKLAGQKISIKRAPLQQGVSGSQSVGLPLDLDFRGIELQELDVAASLFGVPVKAQAKGRLAYSQNAVDLDLEMGRTDRSGHLNVVAKLVPLDGQIDARLSAHEESGGLVANLLGIPQAGAFTLDGQLQGTPGDLEGQLSGELVGAGEVFAELNGGVRPQQTLAASLGWVLDPSIASQSSALEEVIRGQMVLDVAHADAGLITAKLQTLGLSGVDVSGTIELAPARQFQDRTLQGGLRLVVKPALPAHFGIDLGGSPAQFDLQLAGTPAAMTVNAAAVAEEIAFAGVTASDWNATFDMSPAEGSSSNVRNISLQSEIGQISGGEALAALAEGVTHLEVSGTLADGWFETVSPISLRTNTLKIEGSGRGNLFQLAGDAELSIDLNELSSFPGAGFVWRAGGADIKVSLSSDGAQKTADFVLATNGSQLATTIEDMLGSGDIRGTGRVQLNDTGDITINQLALSDAGGAWSANLGAEIALKGDRDSRLRVEIPSYRGQLKEGQPIALSNLEIDLQLPHRATGAFREVVAEANVGELTVAGAALGRVEVGADAKRTHGVWQGDAFVAALGGMGQAQISNQFEFGDSKNWSVTNVNASVFGLDARGQVAMARGELSSDIQVNSEDLTGIGEALAGVLERPDLELSGSFAGQSEIQGGDLLLEGAVTDVRVFGLGVDLSAERIDLSTNGKDPSQFGHALLTNASLGSVSFTELGVDATGTPSEFKLMVAAEGIGSGGGSAAAELTADISSRKAQLEKLEVKTLAGKALLQSPMRLDWSSGISTSELLMSIQGTNQDTEGSFSIAANQSAAGWVASADLREIDLDLVRVVLPLGPVRGALNATMSIDTTQSIPQAEISADLTGRAIHDVQNTSEALFAKFDGKLKGSRTILGLEIGQGEQRLGSASLELQTPTHAKSGLPTITSNDAMSGQVQFNGPIDPFVVFVPSSGIDLSGMLVTDIEVGGAFDQLVLDGDIELKQARVEHFNSGFIVQGLSGVAQIGPNNTRLTLFGVDPEGGQLEAFINTAGFGIEGISDAELKLIGMKVWASEGSDIYSTGVVRLDSSEDRLVLSGALDIDRGLVVIPNQGSGSIVDIEVEELGRTSRPLERGEIRRFPIALDVAVRTQNDIRFMGRGIDSHWGGSMAVKGYMHKPRLFGDMNLTRGQFVLGKRRFELANGRLRFVGDERINPQLRVQASHETDKGFQAIVDVSGTARNPVVQVSSVPSLPQEQVMAEVLFGKPLDQLSHVELLQLFQSAASLSGALDGLGPIAALETTLSLDELDVGFDPDSETVGSGLQVTAGKRVSDDVLVRVVKDVDAAANRVEVEWELTDQISGTSEVRQNGASGVGLSWSKDY